MVNRSSLLPIFYFFFFLMGCNEEKNEQIDIDQPNILWITCEDLSPLLGAYGDPVASTPNLDKLAATGIRYDQAYATAPVCSPARSCLVTGVYATSLGTHNHRSDFNIPAEIKTLPQLLRQYGYYCTNNYKEDYNFSDSTIWDETGHQAHWRNRPGNRPFFSVFNFETTHQSRIFGDDEIFYQRFGKLLSVDQRHHPDSIMLPPYYLDSPEIRKLWARYYDLVTIMDQEVGDIIDQLEKDGLRENTIIFYFSDHGTGMPRSKGNLYVSGLRVPFIVSIPEKYRNITDQPPGSASNELVSFVDFQPTVLSILNKSIPAYMQGIPFMGALQTGTRKYIFGARDRIDETFETSRTVKSSKYSYIRNFLPQLPLMQPDFYNDQSEIMIELYRMKDITKMNSAQQTMWMSRKTPEELYDIEKDPYEVHNLARDPAYREILFVMRKEMEDWMIKTFESGLMPEGYIMENLKKNTVYELARSRDRYPIREILQVTDLLLENPIDQDKISANLESNHELIRYWAVISLGYIENPSASTIEKLTKALSDPSLYVRMAAADALCTFNQCNEEAQMVIFEGLKSKRMIDVLVAARIFELHAEKANSIADEVKGIQQYLTEITEERQWKGYDINALWALNEAFSKLDKKKK